MCPPKTNNPLIELDGVQRRIRGREEKLVTRRPPPSHPTPQTRPRDDRAAARVRRGRLLHPSDPLSLSRLVWSRPQPGFRCESVLYNNNLLPKAQKNKAGEKLSALF